ncbi:MAG: anti-sigma factor antagonist [Clostridia bacterium]|nr:anti-sigma factor antagonist [Clostridia bacterium]
MQVNAKRENNILYIRLCGELDEHSAAQARHSADTLAESSALVERAVFDLGEVSFMDSTGIGFLIGRYKKFRRLGVPVYITNTPPTTDKILMMSGIYSLIPKI